NNDVKIVVLGSSTAEGNGVGGPSESWVGELSTWLEGVSNSSEVINLAKSGFSTEDIRANGSTPAPDVTRNITHALSLNPDIIIVNLPSNNVADGIEITTTIAHFNELKDLADANDVQFFLTTTQPRNFPGLEQRQELENEAIAIRDEFGDL